MSPWLALAACATSPTTPLARPEPVVVPPAAAAAMTTLIGYVDADTIRETAIIRPAGGAPIELTADYNGDAFLVARRGGQVVWKHEQYPAAGGSEVTLFGFADRRIVFLTQSRIGTWALDAETGATLTGWDQPVAAPDGSWALLTPYMNDFTYCVERLRPVRVRLDRALEERVVPATPVPASVGCDNPDELRELFIRSAAAIAPDGKRYAVALQLLAEPGLGDGKVTVELFDAASDKLLGTREVKLPIINTLAFGATADELLVTADGIPPTRVIMSGL